MATEQQKRPEDNLDDLASLYGEVRGQEPTSDLDASILAAARAEVAAEPPRPVAEAWRTPFAAVASVMLCTVIYFSLPDPDTADYLPVPGVAEAEFGARVAPAKPRPVGSSPAAAPASETVAPERRLAESVADQPVDQVSHTPLVSFSEDRAAAPAPPQAAGTASSPSFVDHQATGQADSAMPGDAEPAVEWSSDAGLAAKGAPAEAMVRLVTGADQAPEMPDTRTLPQEFLDALHDGLVQRIHVAGNVVAGSGAPTMDSESVAAPGFTLETSCALPDDREAAHVLLLLSSEQEDAPGGAAGKASVMADAGAAAGRTDGLCVRVVIGQEGLPDAFARAWATMRADGTVRRLLDQYGLQQWSPR